MAGVVLLYRTQHYAKLLRIFSGDGSQPVSHQHYPLPQRPVLPRSHALPGGWLVSNNWPMWDYESLVLLASTEDNSEGLTQLRDSCGIGHCLWDNHIVDQLLAPLILPS